MIRLGDIIVAAIGLAGMIVVLARNWDKVVGELRVVDFMTAILSTGMFLLATRNMTLVVWP